MASATASHMHRRKPCIRQMMPSNDAESHQIHFSRYEKCSSMSFSRSLMPTLLFQTSDHTDRCPLSRLTQVLE